MPNLIFCFPDIPKIFIIVRVRQVAFFISGLKKVFRLKQCPLYGFRFRMREREIYRKQTRSYVSLVLYKVSALDNDRFMQVSLHTVLDYLQILKPNS